MTRFTPEPGEVARFLGERFAQVDGVELLRGGGWSSAYGFRSRDRELVVRFGAHRQDYEKDRVAAQWAAPELPIPQVVEIGDAFGGAYAVSHRCFGEGLDALTPARVDAVIANLSGTLHAIRGIELPGKGFGMWQGERCDAPFESWRDYLVSGKDRDESRLQDWRRRLAAHRTAQAAFDRGHRVIARLAQACPNARHVIHNDVPNNLLVSRDNRISGLFDWGNALAGDPLYDVAWLSFAAPWYPGIDRSRVMTLAQDRIYGSDVEARLACYEMHLSLDALQYLASADRSDELEATALRTVALLDRLS